MRLFNEQHNEFRQKVRTFVEKEINPHAGEWERNREIPRALWKKMGDAGFLGFWYEREYGGQNLDVAYSVILAEELGRSDCSGLTVAISVHNDMASSYLGLFGTHEQKIKYLTPCIRGDAICAIAVTEPDTGSDVATIGTTAVRDGNHYVLNGQKTYTTNGYYGDIVVTAAKTDKLITPPFKGISLFIVERETKGFSASKLEKMGIPASDTAELVYEDCRIPAENLIGSEGSGFKYIMKCFQRERLISAVMSVAYCEKAIEATVDFCRNNSVSGSSLISFQANKHKLVEMISELEMAKVFTYDCCQEYMAGNDVIKEISMAKYLTGQLVNRVARDCMGLQGEYGYLRNNVVCKIFTDGRLNTIAGGTTEIMKEIIGNKLGF